MSNNWGLLETSDFEIESGKLVSIIISSVVFPEEILGFIYSFFNDIESNDLKKNSIIPFSIQPIFSFGRDSKLYNHEKKTITLTEFEINYINQSCFEEKLKKNYDTCLTSLDTFHRAFSETNRFSIIENYQTIMYFLNTAKGVFRKGIITNPEKLTILRFKDLSNERLKFFQKVLQNYIDLQTNISNVNLDEHYPNDIFKSYEYYKRFTDYSSKYILEPYKDFSYLFQKMLSEKMIYPISHKYFAIWLNMEDYINGNIFEEILEKGNFLSLTKSESKVRKINFEQVFQI